MKNLFVLAVIFQFLIAPSAVVAAAGKLCVDSNSGKIRVRNRCKARQGETHLNMQGLQALVELDEAVQRGERGPAGPKGDRGDAGPIGLPWNPSNFFGAVVGQVGEDLEGCGTQARPPTLKATQQVWLEGQSFSAYLDGAGNFKMHNVTPGTYTLVLPGNPDPVKQSIEVVAGEATDIGYYSVSPACCGNGIIEPGEVCETNSKEDFYDDDLQGNGCDSQGYECSVNFGAFCHECKSIDYSLCGCFSNKFSNGCSIFDKSDCRS